jgi:phospholipase C
VLTFQVSTRYGRDIHGTLEEFMNEAAEGRLPAVSFIIANALKTSAPDGDNEHPPNQIQLGQKFSLDIVRALFKSPQWPKTALFINYDEHGGLYDHVPPPRACPPDDKPPRDKDGNPLEGAFDTLGVRVPLLVVSPYAKRGHVSHDVYDHTSILRFIQAKYRVPALTKRDANALPPLDFFDFGRPPDLTTPALPDSFVNEGELEYCKQTF